MIKLSDENSFYVNYTFFLFDIQSLLRSTKVVNGFDLLLVKRTYRKRIDVISR